MELFILVAGAVVLTDAIKFPLEAGEDGDRMVIQDSNGDRVKLACVNWYGAHMENLVVNGLDVQTMDFISTKIKELGFNCVRLPFALDTFYKSRVISDSLLTANPALHGKTAMEIFDKTVESLSNQGLMVILNNHISTAKWCCDENDGEGLWFTNEYSEEDFEDCLLEFTERYKHINLVVGMDLRNELRKSHGVPAAWGSGEYNDWAAEAERIGNKILEINPDLLIFVEGVSYALDLTGARSKHVELTNPKKLVYSGHVYAFSYILSDVHSYEDLMKKMHSMQSFVADQGHDYSAPYWMGEFGTGDNGDKWQYIIQFLKENDHDWAYCTVLYMEHS
ncbi:uncharacterized protein LOC111703052 isoform X2 [Eurytemora carolleeae]|uniref:uncharacterized protein LOC111703052 isoform X2 n=1 Tax=Eurytemora carolleeae TaxID=1294199 RepID=UPI000C769BB5|nr:uncharacterized protein LOC111703052 isoform X2 [Eurytemora carolleeae]|eukprot:XP_023330673.1 uncharacterized protein LOC111703052 isoform X2 [Eurytemora affinis]